MKFIYNSHIVYQPKYILTQYNDTHYKLTYCKAIRQKGYEKIDSKYKTTPLFADTESERTSLSRTKRHIKEICLANNFKYFATITINSKYCNRYKLDECQKLLKKTLKKIKRKNNDFSYIFITEKHKDGAFHFHGLVSSLDLYENENHYFSNLFLDKIGFNSFSMIKSYNKCCNYITKYITKDCVKNSHNQIYISSRGLKKAVSYEVEPINIKWSYENDFIKCREFDISELSSHEFFEILGLTN